MIVGPRMRTWLLKVERGAEFHTHLGVLKHDSIIGARYGSAAKTSKGHAVYVMKPYLEDYIMLGKRRTQIVYPKDMGLIALKTGIGRGSRVVEVGTGSGALTMFLASVVAPDGRVYSYEIRKEFVETARANLTASGLIDYVELKNKDAKEGVDEQGVDAFIVDIGDPWSMVKIAYDRLKPSGGFAAIAPTYNQVEKLVDKLRSSGFILVEAFETLFRRIESKPGATRPTPTMISHTAFIVTARRVSG